MLTVERKAIHIGHYLSEEEAARAFDEQAGALNKPVNFPRDGQESAVKQGVHGIVSTYVGVSWDVSSSKWLAQVSIDRSMKSLGYFGDETEAAKAYDFRAKTLGRPLNFPGEGEMQALKPGSSNFRGAHWNGKEWEAAVIGVGTRTHLGVFTSEVEAARAYDDHLYTAHGSSRVNFPGEGVGELRQANAEFASKFVGVSRRRTLKGSWDAKIKIDGKTVYLGTFETEEIAARKHDERAEPLDRPVNFPKKGQIRATKLKSSKFRGVSKRNKKWSASISVAGKSAHIGVYGSEEEAARAFDERAALLGRAVNFVN
jgi:hypothetical protein